MAKRVALVLSDDALRIVDYHAAERARGEFVSKVIADWEQARRMVGVGAVERIEARMLLLRDEIIEALEAIQ